MNKALRFVWLSLLTLICGVASAGTVVFDPTQDAKTTASVTKDGITFEVIGGNRMKLDAYDQAGTTCWWFTGRYAVYSPDYKIRSVTFECLEGSNCNLVNYYASKYKKDNSSTASMVKYVSINPNGELYSGTDNYDKIRFGSSGENAYITKVTVEYVGGEDPGPDPGTGPGTGGEAGQTTTIAQLAQGGVNVASANIQFTNAQVVYAEGNNYIVRENNQALDILNTSLNLKQGQYVTGTVVLNVNYNSGILTTSDVAGVTDDTKLTFSGDELNEPLPIYCPSIVDIANYPGDLVEIKNQTCYYENCFAAYSYSTPVGWHYLYISNSSSLKMKNGNKYDAIVWFNSFSGTQPQGKAILVEPVITSLAAPTISGEVTFTSTTTVTITSTEEVAKIYYTLNGEEPTQASTLYEKPFTLDKTATVKAVAIYKEVRSTTAQKTFTKMDLSAPKTIAELFELQQDLNEVNVKLADAQVVYADGNNNYIVRENNKALDILKTSLSLKQGQKVTGTVTLSVKFNNGILTASDVTGKTNGTNLTLSGEETAPLPIECATVGDVKNYPGDLISLKNKKYNIYSLTLVENYIYVYLSNASEFNMEGKNYDVTIWYNDVKKYYSSSYPLAKVVEAEIAITSLPAPTIEGEAAFTGSTTVTIKSSESVASIYYTLDGTEPTTESILYKNPFVLDKTTTVKAIAVYKTVTSPVASMDFQLIDLSAPQTIRDLSVMEKNLESVTVRFDNAQVVYGEGKNYILREKFDGTDYALDVLNTDLPLQVGATVSGTVKLQVAFKANPAENNGVLSTADITETLNHNLTITRGASVMSIPLNVSIVDVRKYPGDLLKVTDGWWYDNYGRPQIYGTVPDPSGWGSTEYDVYISNHSDYSFINEDPNVILWYNDVYTDDQSPLAKIIGKKDSYEYKMTAAGWGTIIIPFDCEKPEGLTIYECTSVNDGKLVVEEVNSFKANTPYLLKGPKDVETTYPLEGYAAKHEDKYEKGVMVGVYSWQEPPADSYVLQNQDEGLAFYRHLAGNGVEVGPNRCYIKPQSGELKSIQFPDDETNGVAYANATDSSLVDVYTTAGVKVKHQVKMGKALNDLPAGLYIINNKKIVKK
ncbi:MAG TPA: hypothetical protein DCP79_07670 [Prevotella sp.]|nr:hypothetical protein [Prevotella sp.]